MSKKISLVALSVMIALSFTILSNLSYAQDESKDKRIDELLKKVSRLENRVEELESDGAETALETQINALMGGGEAGANDFRSFWKSTLNFATESKVFTLKYGGRIQTDFVFGTQDDDYEAAIGDFEDGVEMRRSRIYIQGTIYENVHFKAQWDFAGGDADFKDMWIAYQLGFARVTVGQFKQPMSLNELTSSKYTTFMERALPNVFVPSRHTGIMLSNTALEDDRMTWAVSFYRMVDSYGDSAPAQDGKYNFAARVTGLPVWEDGGRRLVHLGVAFNYRNPDGDMVRFRQRPEIHLSPRIVDTGAFSADDVMIINVDAAVVLGPFSAQAEFFYTMVDRETGGDVDFWGAYAFVSYFITGEHRPYKKSAGAFSRVKPNHNWGSSEGHGAWEVALRASILDLDDGAITGGEAFNITVAVNWYLNPNTMIRFNYIFTDIDELGAGLDASAHIFGMRFQVDF